MRTAQAAVKNAIAIYADSLGVSFQEAIELCKNDESTRDCIGFLVLAQADRAGLKKMASTLSPHEAYSAYVSDVTTDVETDTWNYKAYLATL